MPIERVFLGWRREGGPLLARAARWVWDEFGAPAGGDLGGVTVALPGARAGRRFEGLLAEAAGGAVLSPRVLTPGRLPDMLDGVDEAGAVTGLAAAWGRAVGAAQLPAAERAALLGDSAGGEPAVGGGPADDPLGWLAIGRALSGYVSELATGLVEPAEVVEAAASLGAWGPRYRAAAAAESAYRAALAERGRVDRDASIVAAARSGRATRRETLVLVGLADLRPIDRRTVEAVASSGGRVVALVFAEPAAAEGFDSLGGLQTQWWAGRATGLAGSSIRRVQRVSDQGAAAVEAIDRLIDATDGAVASTADVTVALGDESAAAGVGRAIEIASDGRARGRSANAHLWGRSPVGRLIDVVASYCGSRRMTDLGRLIRHPDVERRLDEGLPDALSAGRAGRQAAGWPGRLAEFIDATLAERWDDGLAADDRWSALREARALIEGVLPSDADGGRRARLDAWAPAVRALIRGVYGESWSPRSGVEADRLRWEAIEALAACWDRWERLAEPLPSVTWPEALRLTLAELSDRPLTAASREGDVELVGWLELALDDAPAAIVCGVTEGTIPSGGVADAWLPDRLRGRLGLVDARRRWARDGYLMAVLVASRAVEAIVPMQGDDGESMTPSRLLMQGREGPELAEGVLELFDDRRPIPATRSLGWHGRASRFLVPRPIEAWSAGEPLRVGDFGLFLRDPYRFYIERVLGLQPARSPAALELDGLNFGRVLHRAVEVLGEPDLRGCTDAGRLREAMVGAMRRALGRDYGGQPVTAVKAQSEMMADRLAVLAERQAELAREGWRVARREAEVAWEVAAEHDGRPVAVTIVGRIDRVDVHDDGRVRLIDYKTGDSGRSPRQTHRDAQGGWIDLQLPLYAEAAARRAWVNDSGEPLPPIDGPADVELGYVLVPKATDAVGWVAAGRQARGGVEPWDAAELVEAYRVRDAVVRDVLRGGEVFWPEELPRDAADAVSAMAGVHAADRAALLRSSGWSGGAS